MTVVVVDDDDDDDGDGDDQVLWDVYATFIGKYLPSFRRIILPSSSLSGSSRTALQSFETSVSICESIPRIIYRTVLSVGELEVSSYWREVRI